MHKKLPLSVLVGFILSTPLHAEEAVRQHGAHVHGSVEMNIAQDGHDLLIEVTSPGMDIVGFEHAPESEAEKQKVAAAIKTLNSPNQLITINSSADCSVETVNVHSHGENAEDGHHDHEEHAHEHHDDEHEAKEHDHEAHEEHEHEGHDHSEHAGHKDYTIEYAYHCEQVEKLESLSTTWFKEFPTVQQIHVNVFTDSQQAAVELKAEQPSVKL
jgi:hypothetical protein